MKEKKFWKWFEANQSKYLQLDDLSEQKKDFLLDQFLIQLHQYNNNLFFQIGGDPLKVERELIISAEGNPKYYEEVEKLVAAAPKLDSWKFISFKQPKRTDFVTKYEELLLDPKKMWFLPLSNENNPYLIGLRVCIDHYDPNKGDKFEKAIYQVLDTILGEKTTSLYINHLEIDDLIKYNIEKDGLIELVELKDYITWKRSKINNK
jgi:hypothetical protein